MHDVRTVYSRSPCQRSTYERKAHLSPTFQAIQPEDEVTSLVIVSAIHGQEIVLRFS